MREEIDCESYEWPELLRAYFGVQLSKKETITWHIEVLRKLGGITDGQMCEAIREWGWSSEKTRRRPTLHDLVSHLKDWRKNNSGPNITPAIRGKIKYYKQKILAAKDNEEIWFLICQFCHQHDDGNCRHTKDLEQFAKYKKRFKRPSIKPLLEEIDRMMSELGMKMNSRSKSQKILLDRDKEKRAKRRKPF